jgi:hypothetical protein
VLSRRARGGVATEVPRKEDTEGRHGGKIRRQVASLLLVLSALFPVASGD